MNSHVLDTQRAYLREYYGRTLQSSDDLTEKACCTDATHARHRETVALLPDEAMRELNDRFLGRDRTTDVLAFALEGGGTTVLGDVYLGYEQASRQAKEAGVSLSEELIRLAVHGTLHVLGHDHPEGPDRVDSPMFRLQEELISRLLEAVGLDG